MKNQTKLSIIVPVLAAIVLACGSSTKSEQTIIATATSVQSQLETKSIEKTTESPSGVDEPTSTVKLSRAPEPTETLEPTKTPKPTSTSVPTKTPEPTFTSEPTKVPGLGDVVEGFGYSLSAVTVEDPATKPGYFYEPATGKKLVAVEFIVGNSSGEIFSSNMLYATLIDSEGFAYGPDLGSIEEQMQLLDIAPGERVKGWVGFILPEDAELASFKYAIRGSSSKVLQVGLLEPETAPTKEPEPTNTPRPDLPKLGDIVENYGYTLSAVAVEDPATKPGYFYEQEEGKKLAAVEFIIGNSSGETFTSNVLYAVLVDTQGFVYGAETGTVEKQMQLLDITPGERIRGWAGFLVPEGSTPAYFKYAIRGSSSKVLQVDLLKPETSPAKEPEPTNTPRPNLPKLGDVVENYGYTLSAVAVEDPATKPGYFYEQAEGEKLIAIELIVGNLSGEAFSSNVLYAVLVDTQGFVYGAEAGAIDNQMELLDVNQGEKVKGWAGFIVPEGSTPAYLKYAIRGSEEKTLIVGLLP